MLMGAVLALAQGAAAAQGEIGGWSAASANEGQTTAIRPSSSVSATTRGAGARAESGPAWSTLSAAHRAALAPLSGAWSQIDADQKRKWLDVAQRFPSEGPTGQARIQARMTAWAQMSPQQRGQTRLRFKEAQHLAPAERQARWDAYQALPPEQKQRLAERAVAADAWHRDVDRAPHPARVDSGGTTANVNAPATEGLPRLRPVAPTIVKAGRGATTTLISKTGAPPAHQRPGMPKIAVGSDDVNRTTLLPKRGAQSAISAQAVAASTAGARR